MQGTLFREMVDMFADLFEVGNCYEICQGVIKQSLTKYTQDKNENCFVFDRYSLVKAVEDDPEIVGSHVASLHALQNVYFSNLEEIAGAQP